MKKFFIVLFIISLFANISFAQTTEEQPLQPTEMETTPRPNLPDISFVGDITGKFSDDKEDKERNKILVREVEFAFQGYLYPEMRADIFFAFHREEDGTVHAELEEAYVSFLRLAKNLSGIVGKKLIDFGKINKLHPDQWEYTDRPQVLKNFLGDHGLVGQGAVLSYLLPAKRFVQIDLGTWYVEPHHHANNHNQEEENHEEETHVEKFSLADKLHTVKLWTSYPLSDISELELGLSFTKGKGPHFKEHKDNVEVYGIDLTYRQWPHPHKRILFQNEILFLRREVSEGGKIKRLKRCGFYSFLQYKISRYYDFGIRYDNTEDAILHNEDVNKSEKSETVSFIATRHLTETTKLRLQYKYDIENKNNTAYLQLQFGIGPHAHPLK